MVDGIIVVEALVRILIQDLILHVINPYAQLMKLFYFSKQESKI